ncbi:hypothetical protein M758_9G096200 [Ceratodon purpureus]|nr:hypothetical protein M758_9G095700 [Ceratodon purpureus]KAG0605893.1 hypothetical protein M758_9G096200 [Ceratodon purpureus]
MMDDSDTDVQRITELGHNTLDIIHDHLKQQLVSQEQQIAFLVEENATLNLGEIVLYQLETSADKTPIGCGRRGGRLCKHSCSKAQLLTVSTLSFCNSQFLSIEVLLTIFHSNI